MACGECACCVWCTNRQRAKLGNTPNVGSTSSTFLSLNFFSLVEEEKGNRKREEEKRQRRRPGEEGRGQGEEAEGRTGRKNGEGKKRRINTFFVHTKTQKKRKNDHLPGVKWLVRNERPKKKIVR